MSGPLRVRPLTSPPDAVVPLPGSKSLTNRALLTAALADGASTLEGVLLADDTLAMIDCLRALGVGVELDEGHQTAIVQGTSGRFDRAPRTLHARQAGTVARFLPPAVAAGKGEYRFDGDPQLRARPMGPMLDALRQLGAVIEHEGEPDRLPFKVDARAAVGGTVRLAGDVSSQFVSGLLMAGPLMADGLQIELDTPAVSEPYLEMTLTVMREFGAIVERPEPNAFTVTAQGYRARRHRIEPDASAASYFFAAAAICRGRVRVPGLGSESVQGDVGFVDLLERMGAGIVRDAAGIEVTGGPVLHGIDANMGDISDTAQTMAAVAVFAGTPTRVSGVGFTRAKETDRVGSVVRELRRCGIDADEEPDGFVVRPGTPKPARVVTDGDHRMAMSFALLGLAVDGIEIDDPDCVAKTFPGYWEALELLR